MSNAQSSYWYYWEVHDPLEDTYGESLGEKALHSIASNERRGKREQERDHLMSLAHLLGEDTIEGVYVYTYVLSLSETSSKVPCFCFSWLQGSLMSLL